MNIGPMELVLIVGVLAIFLLGVTIVVGVGVLVYFAVRKSRRD